MGNQEIAAPDEAQQCPPGDRKDVVPRQAAPDGLELQHALQRGIAGIISAVQRADAGADHHIRRDAVGGERVHHAHLDGAKTASAGEDKGRLAAAGVVGSGQGSVRSGD